MNKFRTIKFSQLLASVEEDMRRYADEDLINPSSLIKVVRRCNEVLGLNLYNKKTCIIPVKNYKADLPLDFYKMEMVFSIHEGSYYTGPIATGNHYEWETVQNACFCDNNTAVCVIPLEQHQPKMKYKRFTPLSIGSGDDFLCEYSPNRVWNSKYTIDLSEDLIETPFEKGVLFICYLADLTDPETGELLIPFHSQLNPYYEYSVQTKILENAFINSDDDVEKKLAYVKAERNASYSEAVQVVMSKTFKEWSQYHDRYQKEFFNQYYKIFL